ncbi:MAG: alginate lyase family protein [Burkholderiales bacterium]|nr:alginate lyase family protein [Burkholderiales bacterium]
MGDDEAARWLMEEKDWRHPPLPVPDPRVLVRSDQILAGAFTYVGATHVLADPLDWTLNPSRDKEWLIAHHKLYALVDLMQAYRATRREAYIDRWSSLAERWLDQMSSGFITASDAQVEAKRVESLATCILLARDARAPLPGALLRRLLARLADEVDFIAHHLHPTRNHRTFQLCAMVMVGLLFKELEDAPQQSASALRLLEDNLLDDFLPSGVHVERSTHYHNITLEAALSVVELAKLNGAVVSLALDERLRRALIFSAWFQFPDGEIPLINDSDTLDHRAMFEAGYRLYGAPEFLWAASRGAAGHPPTQTAADFDGYVVLTSGWGTDRESYASRQHVFIDCAPLGVGSHSHYDFFSFTWFAGGRQIIVDPGRYTYDANPVDGIDWRREFKSTRAHNTVAIDGRDQTRYLSKSKIPPPGVERYDKSVHGAKHGPEVEILWLASDLDAASPWVMGAARSLEYGPVHYRAFVFVGRSVLLVADVLDPPDDRTHRYDSRFHLAGDWSEDASLLASAHGCLVAASGWHASIDTSAAATSSMAQGWVSKTYGIKSPAPVIVASQVECGRVGAVALFSLHGPAMPSTSFDLAAKQIITDFAQRDGGRETVVIDIGARRIQTLRK